MDLVKIQAYYGYRSRIDYILTQKEIREFEEHNVKIKRLK